MICSTPLTVERDNLLKPADAREPKGRGQAAGTFHKTATVTVYVLVILAKTAAIPRRPAVEAGE
jgi:hypothetical protein